METNKIFAALVFLASFLPATLNSILYSASPFDLKLFIKFIFYVLFYVLVYLKLSDCLHTNFKSKFFSNLRQPLVSKLFFHLLNFYLSLPFLLLNLPFSSFTLLLYPCRLLLHTQSFLVQLSNFFLFLLSKSLLLTFG